MYLTTIYIVISLKALFDSLLEISESGGKKAPVNTNVGFTREQADAILRIKNGRDNYEKLGVHHTATRWVKVGG